MREQTAHLERGDLARQSLEQFGALVLVADADEAAALADEIAPEHLHIATENAEQLLDQIRHAGAVFLGNYSPVAVGDYVAGPSHVLPTGGTARFASGLSARDFLRSHSVISFSQRRPGGAGRRRARDGRKGRTDGAPRQRGDSNSRPPLPRWERGRGEGRTESARTAQ